MNDALSGGYTTALLLSLSLIIVHRSTYSVVIGSNDREEGCLPLFLVVASLNKGFFGVGLRHGAESFPRT